MSSLRELIKENLLLEKRIAQIVHEIQTQFNFEISRTTHSSDRSTRPELKDSYNQREITNMELKEFVPLFIREIAEKIVSREINDKEPFIIKSIKWELALPIIPIHNGGSSWTLLFSTSFRESEDNPFRVGKNQLVLWR
jgi:hypothetical protein